MNAVSPRSSAELGAGLAYLPIFLNLRERVVLLIGGGEGAEPKRDLLQRAGARVRLVTGTIDARHFEDAAVAVDASGDPEINGLSRRLAREAGVPLNVVDRPALCDFIFPAILDRTPVIVAVSTGGLAPAIARLIRQRLEIAIPSGIGRLATLAARLRATAAERLKSCRQATLFWERLFEGDAAELALAGRLDDAAILAEDLIAELEAAPEAADFRTLTVNTDDPELLTLRAAGLIRMADLIIHDPTVAADILTLGRRDARRIALGTSEAPGPTLEQIKRRHCRRSHRVVYLRT